MHKLIKLAVLILSVPIIFLIYKGNNKNYINITILGDGLSQGINSYEIIDYGYGDYLKDYYQNKNLLKNYSKDITKSDMSIEMLNSYILMNKKVNSKNKKDNIKQILTESSVIIMSIGLNDLLYKITLSNQKMSTINTVVDEVYNDLKNLLKEINKYSDKICIVGDYESKKYNYKMNYAITKYNELIKSTEKIIYIDTNSYIKDSKYLENPYSYYPNTKGYQQITSKILSKKGKKLEKT